MKCTQILNGSGAAVIAWLSMTLLVWTAVGPIEVAADGQSVKGDDVLENTTDSPGNAGSPGDASKNWRRHEIARMPQRAIYVAAADLDGDRDLDVVAGAWWWENPGLLRGDWRQHTIGDPLRNMAMVYDFDRDGDPDVLGTQAFGSAGNHDFVWARNDGSGRFTVLDNIDYAGPGDFLQGCAVGDFGAGLQVALSWHRDGEGIRALNVPKDPVAHRWTSVRLSETMSDPPQGEDLSVGDIDRDGDLDLLLGVKWLQNNGNAWTPHVLGAIRDLDERGESDRNDLADINGDGRLDAVVGLENGTHLFWYAAPVDPTQAWARHVIADVAGQGFSMDTRDFDDDGDPDVVLGEHRGPRYNRVLLFENLDRGQTWRQHLIDVDATSVIDHHDGTQAADLDGDGDLDVISIGWNHPTVWIFENLSRGEADR